MSLLDTRFPELDLFLQQWRRRLNLRFLAGEFLIAWSVTAPVALLAAGFMGGPLRLFLGTAITVLGAAGYTLWRAGQRLSRSQAASWIDETGRTHGLFRAASEALEQTEPGEGGLLVLAEADRRRVDFKGKTAPRLPWRRLGLRAALATALSLGFVVALVMVVPAGGFRSPQTEPEVAAAPGQTPEPGAPGDAARELTPQEAAKRLFPEDARLAALAEQALASGDPGALDALLEQNAGAASRAERSPAQAGETNKANPSQSDQGRPGARSGSGNRSPGQKGEMSPLSPESEGEGSSETGDSKSSTQRPSGPGDPSDPSRSQGSSGGSGAGRPGQPGEGAGEDAPMGIGGGDPGEGHSVLPLGARASQKTSDKQVPIKEKGAPGVFEYVLPGAESKLPTAEVLAHSQRAAEAVISRTAPPLEFENTIRDYFLSLSASPTVPLSQEVSP